MSNSFKKIIKNISYSFSANLISLLMSVVSFLVVPKVLPIVDYGVWQLYNFYLSYVGFFHFGWLDGIYLRYGSCDYDQLDRNSFAGQYYALAVLELCIATGFILTSRVSGSSEFAINALCMVSIVGVFVILTSFTSFVLQFTNRIKDYAKLIFYERVLFFIAIIGYVSLGYTCYIGMFWISFTTKLLALLYSSYLIKDIVLSKIPSVTDTIQEAWKNITVGIKLMLANIAGMLLLGIIRFAISQEWDVAIFGKISLTLNISNFMMVFISAISVVLFPILKRTDQKKLSEIYVVLRNCLSVFLFGLLIGYYPLKTILSLWLPKYADSLIYMAVLFPVCLFESKVSLLINTYLKSLRQEKLMLRINAIAVAISLFSTLVTVCWLHDLNLAVFSIVAVFAFRCVLAEYFLGMLLKINLKRDMLLEALMVVLFIALSWNFNSWWSMLLYAITYLLYLLLKRDDLLRSARIIRQYSA